MELNKILKGMLETNDCLGLKEHKVLTLNTVYKMPIEEPKTQHWKMVKDFGEGCFREGWIHAVSAIMDMVKEEDSPPKPKLKILAAAVLNEDNPEFFAELMSKGVKAVDPEMEKQRKTHNNSKEKNGK